MLITQGNRLFDTDVAAALPHYRRALALYQGEYLQELPYAEWCTEERERIHALTLRTADRLEEAVKYLEGTLEDEINIE